MSEEKTPFFDTTFNGSVKIRSRDHRLTSDAGALLLREADQRLGLIESLASELFDPRKQDMTRYSLTELLRERIYSRILGYSADDDVDLLAHDPAMRIAAWDRPGDRVLEERMGSQPTQSRLIDILSVWKENLEALRAALPDWVARHLRAAGAGRAVSHGTLDIDSFPITVYGEQEGSAFHGYYKEKIYNPIVAGFSPGGDYDHQRLGDGFVHAVLRAGNVDSAQGAIRFIREAVKRSSLLARTLDVRFDAAFTEGPIMDALTDDGIRFVGRIRSNAVLEAFASPHVSRPVGRPPKEGYEAAIDLFWHKALSWRHAQRIVLVIVDKPDPKTGQLELFPRYFFLVTNYSYEQMSPEDLLEHYRQRGTFEDRIGELQHAMRPHLSSPGFAENEASFLLSLLGFNLASILRGEIESESPNGWDLGRLQTTVLKAGARVTKGQRRLFVDLALAVVGFWERLFQRMARWCSPTLWPEPRGPTKRPWMPPPAHAHLTLVLRE
jgi:hypothetical protein